MRTNIELDHAEVYSGQTITQSNVQVKTGAAHGSRKNQIPFDSGRLSFFPRASFCHVM
jgi:hypothetical protein